MQNIHWPLLWAFLFFILVVVEGIALGSGHSEYTLSYTVRLVRFDPIGRFIFLPLWCWLTVHFLIAPKWVGTRFDWRNLVGLLLGLMLAIFGV
jgi:hypothetical protein